MKFLRTVHTYYSLSLFILLFLIFFPLLLIPIAFPKQFRLVGIINRWWARLLFFFSFIRWKVVCQEKLDTRRQYIFCANHFSYLDIPTMGLTPVNAIFVGKNEMENIPLFGFMYRKLHITVDRSRLKSRGNTQLRSLKAIDEGKSLIIFPEGGIVTQHPPRMAPFKDGAFRAAIEKQIPLVPVSIPRNWIILPDQSPLRLRSGKVIVIFHKPIETTGYTLDRMEELKKQVYDVIDTGLTL
jgi:1-acyl-sn-glycerol-3-phosphate acyltransferase